MIFGRAPEFKMKYIVQGGNSLRRVSESRRKQGLLNDNGEGEGHVQYLRGKHSLAFGRRFSSIFEMGGDGGTGMIDNF